MSGNVVDGQMQGDGAVTTVNVREMLDIITRFIVNGVVPLVAGTCSGGELGRDSRMNGKL